MSDEGQEPTNEGGQEQPQDTDQDAPKQQETFDRDYVEGLREENAKWRTKLRELEQQQEEAQEAELAEQKKWRELAEKRAAKVEELEPIKQQYDEMLERLRESNKQRIESIPEAMRSLVPEYDDPSRLATWLDANAAKLTKQPAPNLNGGAGGGERPGAEEVLTDAEIQMAKRLGVSPEDYKKHKMKQ